jgi:small-conductance mechanosensitive channel
MEALKNYLPFNWLQLVIPGGVILATLILGYIAKQLLFRALHRWAKPTRTRADDILIATFSGPFMIWTLMLGLYLAAKSSELSERASAFVGKSLLILWIISITVVISRLAGNYIKYYGKDKQGTMPVTSLTQNLARLLIALIGVLILLNQLGISITPILTALGVGGLAVALALQDTLSNLFAGFYVSLSGHIRPGDYVKLDSGEEGYVADITWRSTTIKTQANNLVITPNAKLAQAIITNYHLPDKAMASRLQVSVSYASEPEAIERILIEEAQKGIAEIPGLLAEPAPAARFAPGFGDSSLDFTLIFHVGEFDQQFIVQHELRKRIFKRFREAGIEIPFPIRTVYLHNPSSNDLKPPSMSIS